MTPSLRMRVVEAGARALDALPIVPVGVAAEAALDAMLDCLTENADEWERLYGIEFEEGRVRSIARHLTEVLREPTDG